MESALLVDTASLLRETIHTMLKNDSTVFRSTFRRAKVYNYDLTQGIPCTGNKPWMHGLKIMENLKKVCFGRNTFKQIELRYLKENKSDHGQKLSMFD